MSSENRPLSTLKIFQQQKYQILTEIVKTLSRCKIFHQKIAYIIKNKDYAKLFMISYATILESSMMIELFA